MQLYSYAQMLESVVREKDEEINRLLFLHRYHYKIQEKKDVMFTKLVENNRNITEQNKKEMQELEKKYQAAQSKKGGSIKLFAQEVRNPVAVALLSTAKKGKQEFLLNRRQTMTMEDRGSPGSLSKGKKRTTMVGSSEVDEG